MKQSRNNAIQLLEPNASLPALVMQVAEKMYLKARCNAQNTPKDESIPKTPRWYAGGRPPRSAFAIAGICAHSSVVAPHMLPRSVPSQSTLHPSACLDLALHLLELLVHVEQFFSLRLSRRRRRLCQSPVKLLVLDVISLKLL
jgi:hypothetical protein